MGTRVFDFLNQFSNLETQAHFGLKAQNFSLDPMRDLLKRHQYQKGSTQFIHVAGSKGKGSMVHFLEAFFLHHHQSVGVFVSPHLYSLTERIRVNGQNITEEALQQEIDCLNVRPGEAFSFFEILTYIAFQHFARCQVKWAIIEVGIGGRVDATNVLEPNLCILTEIALEHQKILGETYLAIAREKLGILKPKVPVLSLTLREEVQALVKEIATQLHCPRIQFGEHFQIKNIKQSLRKVEFQVFWKQEKVELEAPFSSFHQAKHLAGAWVATRWLQEILSPPPLDLLRIPGREEWSDSIPSILWDVAHEELSLNVIGDILEQSRSQYSAVWLLFGCLQDKQVFSVLPRLLASVDHLLLCRLASPRSWNPRVVFERFPLWQCDAKVEVFESVSSAMQRCQRALTPSDWVVITGSFGIVQESKNAQKLV